MFLTFGLSLFLVAVTNDVISAELWPSELRVGWLAPLQEHNAISAGGGLQALYLALQHINDTNLLPGIDIRVSWADSKCDSKTALAAAATWYENTAVRPDMILGPACSYAMRCTAQLASHWNIPVFGMMSSDADLKNRTTYSTLVRMLGPLNTYQRVLAYLARAFKWEKFYMIQDDWSAYMGVATALKNEAALNNYTIDEANQKVSKNTPHADLVGIFKRAKKTQKTIFLMIVNWAEMARYMGAAKDAEMTGEDYVYIFIDDDLNIGDDMRTNVSTKITNGHLTLTDFMNVMHVAMATMSEYEWTNFKTRASEVEIEPEHLTRLPAVKKVDLYAPFLYDAVVTWARLVNETLGEGLRGNNGTHILEKAKNFNDPNGVSGPILLDENADRKQDVWVFDMDESGNFQIVASVNNTKPNFENVLWSNGKMGTLHAPKDHLETKKRGHNKVAEIAGAFCAVVAMVVVFYVAFRMGRRRRLLRSMAWKIDSNDIEYISDPAFEQKAYYSHIRRLESFAKSDLNTSFRRRKPSGVSDVSEGPEEPTNVQIYAPIAYVKGTMVTVKNLSSRNFNLNKNIIAQLNQLMGLKHQNICGFVGACVEPGNVCLMWEYCNKGSLQDVIWNENIKLDSVFQYALSLDVAKGVDYIHKSQVGYHGNLKSSNCVIDSRWTCKLTDFGLPALKAKDALSSIAEHDSSETLLWSAPEILRQCSEFDRQRADIYSLAVVIKEVICRNSPFSEYSDIVPSDVINRITYKRQSRAFRPSLRHPSMSENKGLSQLLQDCWAEDPKLRPSAHRVVKTLDRINPNRGGNMIDNMLSMLEKYANNLEELVTERTRQLDEEKSKTEDLLYRMLPRTVAEDLRMGKKVEAELFDDVTVYFSDIVGFTSICAHSSPLQVVDMLNSLYTLFDDIVSKYDVYKVETIGDAYMLVSGLPRRNGSQHAFHISDCALDLLKSVSGFTVPHTQGAGIRIRVGIHCGPVVAGVVGLTMPRYCLFGDTVNTASRMETTGLPMKIHVSPDLYEVLRQFPDYTFTCRGEIQVKGKGTLTTYFLEDKLSAFIRNDRLVHQNSKRHKIIHKTASIPEPSGTRLLGVSRQSSAKSLSGSGAENSEFARGKLQSSLRSSRKNKLLSEPSLPRVVSGSSTLSSLDKPTLPAVSDNCTSSIPSISQTTYPSITITDSPFPAEAVPIVNLNGVSCSQRMHKMLNGQNLQTYL